MRALIVGLLLLPLSALFPDRASSEISFVRVNVHEKESNLDTRARLHAKKRIFYSLVTDRISFPKNTDSNLKKILINIYYRNYIENIKVKGFKEVSKKKNGNQLSYTFSYKKIVLPKVNLSNVLKDIGRHINVKTFKIDPVHALELSLIFPNEISFKSSLNIWNKKYNGFLKYALEGTLITDTRFIRRDPLNIKASQLPGNLSELLKLNDTMPLNLRLCESLSHKISEKGYRELLKRIVNFCLTAPGVYSSRNRLMDLAIQHGFIRQGILFKNKKLFAEIEKDKTSFRKKYFDIDKFNSISAIINSLGKLPIIFSLVDCGAKYSDIMKLIRGFEKTHSLVNLEDISDWFIKNNFHSLHRVTQAQVNKSVVQSKNKNVCDKQPTINRNIRRSPKIKDM